MRRQLALLQWKNGNTYTKNTTKQAAVEENMAKLYEILWKQCDKIVCNKIKADKKYKTVEI